MDEANLRRLLQEIRDGVREVEDGIGALRDLPFADLGYASVDHHRSLRTGLPEVVFAEGKSVTHLLGIANELARQGLPLLITRLSPTQADALLAQHPELEYNSLARTAVLNGPDATDDRTLGSIAIVTAGTSDMPVAEEAAVTASVFGNPVQRIHDVGVAGLHRLFPHLQTLRAAQVIIVIAGMEGALPSVIAGLVDRPLIAVPTSVGYGASLQGLTPLLGMLSSCASGITVVNIDNGFGAAYAATLSNRLPGHCT